MAKSKKCKKASNPKNLVVAQATTRANKIRKFRKIVRLHPEDFNAHSTLNQLLHDAGLPLHRTAK